MTTFAMRKRLAATGKGTTAGRAGAIACGLVASIALLAALRIALDLRVWWDAAPGSDAASLALVFLFIRNLQGVLILVGAILAVAVIVVAVPPDVQGHLTLAVGLALVLGAARDWWNLVTVPTRRRRELASSDAYILSRKTGVPSAVWLASFAAVIVLAGLASWVLLDGAVRTVGT